MPLATYGTFGNNFPDSPVLTVSMAIEFLSQIGSVLEYMHSNNIIHHDIKRGNILIFENGFALSDFSVSVILNDDNQNSSLAIDEENILRTIAIFKIANPKSDEYYTKKIEEINKMFKTIYGSNQKEDTKIMSIVKNEKTKSSMVTV